VEGRAEGNADAPDMQQNVGAAPPSHGGIVGGGGGGDDEGGVVLSVDQVEGLLRGLANVPRLSMAAMCVPSKERAALRELWEGASRVGGRRAEWEGLRTAFKL